MYSLLVAYVEALQTSMHGIFIVVLMESRDSGSYIILRTVDTFYRHQLG